jgi:hypothetical protein
VHTALDFALLLALLEVLLSALRPAPFVLLVVWLRPPLPLPPPPPPPLLLLPPPPLLHFHTLYFPIATKK